MRDDPLPSTLVARVRAGSLEPGANWVESGSVIVHLGESGDLRATRNVCRHQSGRFLAPGHGSIVTCSGHGWQLDLASMLYVNPTNRQKQPELEVRLDGDWVELHECTRVRPWEIDPGFGYSQRQKLAPGEFTFRFYAHACGEISLEGKSLFTDPWLVGPAFVRGWWLAHEPPSDWLDNLAAADLIYISHNHSDHLNPATLTELAARNPDVPIVVPRFEKDSCVRLARRFGMKNITALPFDTWHPFGLARFMILRDGTTRDDSGLLVEYKGHRILNTVDCMNLNAGVFPENIDLLLTSFAGGASGFPVCWREQFSDVEIAERVRKNRMLLINSVVAAVRKTGAARYVPFAGFFTEAHPADVDIKRLNVKNTPAEVCNLVEKACPGTRAVPVAPGECVDLSENCVVGASSQTGTVRHDFAKWLGRLDAVMEFAPLGTDEGLLEYFRWAEYRGDLILHVVETDDEFEGVDREFIVDFEGPSLLQQRPRRPHRYLRMKVRSAVFRHVMRWGLPWEEISIGFNARFYREPNVYNMDFWTHFQDELPADLPWD